MPTMAIGLPNVFTACTIDSIWILKLAVGFTPRHIYGSIRGRIRAGLISGRAGVGLISGRNRCLLVHGKSLDLSPEVVCSVC